MVKLFDKDVMGSMVKRTVVGLVIALTYAAAILLGYFFDRSITIYFLCLVVAICVIEVRYALGNRISKKLGVIVWCFACSYGIVYYAFGFTGTVLVTLAVFILGSLVELLNEEKDIAKGLMSFAFLMVYPAMIMSSLFYINAAQDSVTGLSTQYNTVGLCLAFVVSSFTDMFAYFFGVLFGKTKLIPSISPKKTVEGAAGGLVGGLIGAAIVYLVFETPFAWFVDCGLPITPVGLKIVTYVAIGIFGSVFTQTGDLVASIVKRYCGIKDYSTLLGPHGGVMDRFDGVMFNAVFIALMFACIL